MAAAIGLRTDYTADAVRGLAKASRDAKQTRRLLALAAIYDGGRRTEAARTGGVGLQIVRDWVLRFNAAGPSGLIDRKAPGKAPLLNEEQRSALARAVEDGPKPYLHGVVRWRLCDLTAWLRDEFGVTVSRQPSDARSRAAAHGLPQPLGAAAGACQDPEAMAAFRAFPDQSASYPAALK